MSDLEKNEGKTPDPKIYYRADGAILAVSMHPLKEEDIPENALVCDTSIAECRMFIKGITPIDNWMVAHDRYQKRYILRKRNQERMSRLDMVRIGIVEKPDIYLTWERHEPWDDDKNVVYTFEKISRNVESSKVGFRGWVVREDDPNVLLGRLALTYNSTQSMKIPRNERFMVMTTPEVLVGIYKR